MELMLMNNNAAPEQVRALPLCNIDMLPGQKIAWHNQVSQTMVPAGEATLDADKPPQQEKCERLKMSEGPIEEERHFSQSAAQSIYLDTKQY